MNYFSVEYLTKKNIKPEDTNKIHFHPFNEIVIIKKGVVHYATDKTVTHLDGESIIYSPEHTLHNNLVLSNNPYERYRIRFDSAFFKDILKENFSFDELLKKPFVKQLTKKDFDEIYSLAESLYKLNGTSDKDRLNKCIHLGMILFKSSNAQTVQNTQNGSYITDILDYIKENYNKPLTLQSLADRFFVSKSKLIYDFKNYCRMNCLEYITMTRIEKAKEYLLKGWSVTATATACGFSTPNYFIKVFSGIIGITPLKFQFKYAPK